MYPHTAPHAVKLHARSNSNHVVATLGSPSNLVVVGRKLGRIHNQARSQVAANSARETLIEAVKTGDTAPDCIQITDSEGREIGIVPLQDLLNGPDAQK